MDKNTNDLLNIDNLEIQPLSDDDLENVVGGAARDEICSVWCCSANADVPTE